MWDGLKPIIEEWTGMELEPSAIHGIREYTEGTILTPHVDRNPLISSAIINVAQEGMEEEWPLEVYGRDGLAYNITLKPGEMVLYESHSLIHGRPFPMKGKSYANMFVHFQPTGKLLRERDTPVLTDPGAEKMPIWILRGSAEEKNWRRLHPMNDPLQRSLLQRSTTKTKQDLAASAGPREALGRAAVVGDMRLILKYTRENSKLVNQKDSRGWQPIHEAARGGHLEVVKYLVNQGANIHERTNFGAGPNVMEIVLKQFGQDNALFFYLHKLGAEP